MDAHRAGDITLHIAVQVQDHHMGGAWHIDAPCDRIEIYVVPPALAPYLECTENSRVTGMNSNGHT